MEHGEPIVVAFPTAAHSLESVKKAAYRLSAAFSFQFDVQGNTIVCSMFPIRDLNAGEREDAKHRLRNEVLDQDLRIVVATETQAIRNAVLALAFSRTGLQDEQVSES